MLDLVTAVVAGLLVVTVLVGVVDDHVRGRR